MAKTRRVAPKYWVKRIKHIIATGGKFTSKEIDKAHNWQVCACGEQDPRIPFNIDDFDNNGPVDRKLNDLGCKFASAVDDQDPKKALHLISLIEDRAAEILWDQKQKLIKELASYKDVKRA